MWGAIIGAAASLAAQGLGMAQSAKAAREANAKMDALHREDEAWYNRRYNEDPLQRTSAQRVLTKMSDMMKRSNKAAAGRAAVAGGTEESVAAEKERNNQALAEAASRIAAEGENRKDQIEDTYRKMDRDYKENVIKREQERANNIAQSTAAVGKAIGSAAAAANEPLDDLVNNIKEKAAFKSAAKDVKGLADAYSLKNFGSLY